MGVEFSETVTQIEANAKAIELAIQEAVREALIEHKLLGQPIVVADDNDNVIWIPAEQIEVPGIETPGSST